MRSTSASSASARSWAITVTLLVAEVLLLGWVPLLVHGADHREQPGSGHVVLLGVPGITWQRVTPTRMPRLFGLAATSGLASLSVRTVTLATCNSDAWLTVSAGRRATADCQPVQVQRRARGVAIVGWHRLVARQQAFGYDATPGLLGQSVVEAGKSICAIGADAALGAADRRGHVAHYWSRIPVTLDPSCAVTLVSATDHTGGAITALSQTVAASDFGGNVDVYIAGIAGAPDHAGAAPARAALRPLLHYQVGDQAPTRPSWLSSDATRWPGMAQLTDLTPTLLRDAHIAVPDDVVGAPIVAVAQRPAGTTNTAHDIRSMVITDQRAHSGVLAGWVSFGVAGLVTTLVILAAVLRNRRGHSRSAGRGAICAAACFLGWIPLASYLTYLWPVVGWLPVGVQTAIGTVVVAAVGAVLVIWRLGRRPHGGGLLAVTIVGGVTACVLGVDQATGGYLQHATPFGNDPVLGGRFYGMRNLTFGVFATSAVLFAAGLAFFLRRQGRVVTVRVVALVGVAAVLVDGSPAAGSDVGGMLALTPGMLLLVLLVAGVAVTWPRLVAVAVAGVLVFLGVAALDYHRPADQRTHIGQFVGRVLHGDAGPVLTRKLDDNLHAVGNPAVALALLAALVILGIALAAPSWSVRRLGSGRTAAGRGRARGVRESLGVPLRRLRDAYAAWPTLQFGVWSLMLIAVLAMLANDSGVVLGLTVAMLLVPLLVAASAIAPPLRRARAGAGHNDDGYGPGGPDGPGGPTGQHGDPGGAQSASAAGTIRTGG